MIRKDADTCLLPCCVSGMFAFKSHMTVVGCVAPPTIWAGSTVASSHCHADPPIYSLRPLLAWSGVAWACAMQQSIASAVHGVDWHTTCATTSVSACVRVCVRGIARAAMCTWPRLPRFHCQQRTHTIQLYTTWIHHMKLTNTQSFVASVFPGFSE